MTTSSYEELKMKGPPLYNQGDVTVVDFDKVEETTLPLDAGRTALLVVDVQPEYWSECPAVRQDFPDFPNHLSNLFHRLHKGAIPPEVHSDPEEATKWEEFAQPLGGEFVIPKTSWSSTSGTCLMDLLQQSGIDTVLVCGLITSVCVQHSAFGIFEAGYRTVLVTDACADRGRARHEAALALYGDYMYELKTVAQVEQELQPAKPVWLIKDKLRRGSAPLNSLQDYIVWNDELTRS